MLNDSGVIGKTHDFEFEDGDDEGDFQPPSVEGVIEGGGTINFDDI